MFKKKLLIAMLLPLLLTGCWDVNEIDKILYIHALGIDYKDGEYLVYAQLTNIGALGLKGEGGSPGSQGTSPASVGIGRGETVDIAVFDFYKNIPQRLFWGHLSSVVFSEDALAQKNIVSSTLDVLNRYRETRYTIWITSTNAPVNELLRTFPAIISPMFTRLSDPLTSYEQSSFIKPKRFQEFLVEINEPAHTAIIPRFELIKDYWSALKKESPAYRINGVNMYGKNGYKGSLIGEQVNGLRWVDEGERISVFLKKDNKVAASIIFRNAKTKITPKIEDGYITFTMEVEAKGIISELYQEVTESELNKLARESIVAELEETYHAALEKDTDIYRVTEKLYRKHPERWKKITHNGNVMPLRKESLKKVNVKAKIDASGKIKLEKT